MTAFIASWPPLMAGTAIAIASGLVGWFAVLRAQVFAADAMSHFAFTGAVAAVAFGVNPLVGLFALTIGCALILAGLGGRSRVDDVTIGVAITWVLGLGVLALSIIAHQGAGGAGATAAITLFGDITAIDPEHAQIASGIAVLVTATVVVIARPLIFATLDSVVARTRGVPVALLGLVFLIALAGVAAEATQAVGALLLLGLVAAPAGAAHRLTSRPYFGMGISVAIGVASVWIGLGLSTRVPQIPSSSAIVGVAALCFAAAGAPRRRSRGAAAKPVGRPHAG
jgi:zinc/manganese transport system permease protein